MKLSPDSPELTAYLLGELGPAERTEVEAALQAAPGLRAELESLRTTSEQLDRALAAEPALELSPEQRAALLGAVAPETNAVLQSRPVSRRRFRDRPFWWDRLLAWRRSLIWTAAAAGALVLTLMLLPRQRPGPDELSELRYQRLPEIQSQPAPTAAPVAAPTPALQEPALQDATAGGTAGSPALLDLKSKLDRVVQEASPEQQAAARAEFFKSAADAAKAQGERETLASEATRRALAMDPLLARRYGLSPRAGLEVRAESLGRQTAASTPSDAYSLAVVPRTPSEQQVELRYSGDSAGRSLESVGQRTDELRGRLTLPGTESYGAITDNPFRDTFTSPLSTFGLDVDTASYANVRRFLRDGSLPPRDAVRIEELINYFRYDYAAPRAGEPFSTAVEMADCPWKEGHKLVRVGLQARTVDRRERPRANLVFLLDVSGSMEPENKLPLVKRSLRLLLERLGEQDSVGIVTYAGESRVALEPTSVSADGRQRINTIIEGLRAGSGTAGAAGIVDAYRLATNRLDRESVNRVILCTDGDFNIGITDPAELQRLIEEKAKSGVFLSVLGYGLGNLKDSTMELLADKGNGNYAYVDSFTEARKVLGEQLEGTLITVAKDVKVQVEFNPARVRSYRLLGYENRALRDRDFNDDTKDAGDVGAGHQVTVLYEIEPAVPSLAGVDPLRYQPPPNTELLQARLKTGHGDELLNLRLRYKEPDGDKSRLIETPVKDGDGEFAQADADFKFAAAVAGYGMLLRDSPYKGDLNWEKVLRLAEQGLGPDKEGYRAEFVDLVRKAQQLGPPAQSGPRPPTFKY